MERSALLALPISLKMTKAWPLIFRLRDTRMSRICPNCEKMAYRDFFSSAIMGWRHRVNGGGAGNNAGEA